VLREVPKYFGSTNTFAIVLKPLMLELLIGDMNFLFGAALRDLRIDKSQFLREKAGSASLLSQKLGFYFLASPLLFTMKIIDFAG